jgi:hypothetical protein
MHDDNSSFVSAIRIQKSYEIDNTNGSFAFYEQHHV